MLKLIILHNISSNTSFKYAAILSVPVWLLQSLFQTGIQCTSLE
uniref:Uncharacterized protein n=1 Tax=Anguilla anguilla TaxID=7936 RepID=A0A0E9RK67_ANGAN